jgi:hypothetical protein
MDLLEERAQRLAFDVMLLAVLLHAGLRAVPSLPKGDFSAMFLATLVTHLVAICARIAERLACAGLIVEAVLACELLDFVTHLATNCQDLHKHISHGVLLAAYRVAVRK